MIEVVRLAPCDRCGHGLEPGAKFCSGCGRRVQSDDGGSTLKAAVSEFASGAAREAKSFGIAAMRSETGKKVAAGAALGAAAGAILPVLGTITGAMLGAGYVAFQRLTK